MSVFSYEVNIRINATASIKYLALKMRRLIEGGVYSKNYSKLKWQEPLWRVQFQLFEKLTSAN